MHASAKSTSARSNTSRRRLKTGSGNGHQRRAAKRGTYAPEERRRVLRLLFAESDDRWRFRFGFLLSLSVAIAVMGLSLDSSAVVIGAMLIAPLMTPVMGTAAAVAMGWSRRLAVAAATVVLASAGSVGLAWLLASVLPQGELTREMLTRTSPDARGSAGGACCRSRGRVRDRT
jgi:uncharacterized membrane protein